MSGPPPGPPPKPRNVPADVDQARTFASELVERAEATMARASTFSEEDRNQRVNDEWSTVESLRHLVLVADLWMSKAVKQEPDPFHAIALPPHFMPANVVSPSIDPNAAPTFAEACDVLRVRLATILEGVDALTADDLARPVQSHAENVAGCLGVLFDEFMFHDSFINRDLDILEGVDT